MLVCQTRIGHEFSAARRLQGKMLPDQPRRVERKDTSTLASKLLKGSINVMVASDKGKERKWMERMRHAEPV
jgi:hypothetical protein